MRSIFFILFLFSVFANAQSIDWGNDTIWGTLTLNHYNASTVPYLDDSKTLQSSLVTPTELGFVHGATSSLCGINQSCTLTNKSLSGSSNTFTSIPLSAFTNLGTTTTVLHGNASGSPTFGAVSLTADISGTLPIANGGTNNSSLGVTAGGVLYTDGSKLINVGAGSSGNFLKSNGASAPTWGSVTAAAGFNFVSKTSAYTAIINDYVLSSGASFIITLPTAVSVAGQQIGIQHAGTSLTQVYTLNTTSSQTIGGIASGSYALYTNGETLVLVSDGANWQILNHKTDTGWIDGGAITIGATTTAPTPSSTVTNNKLRWRRVGDSSQFHFEYRQSSNASAANGVGDYLFPVIANMTIDTSKVTAYATANGWATALSNMGTNVGNATMYIIGGAQGTGNVFVHNSTNVRVQGIDTAPSGGVISANGYQLGVGGMGYQFNYVLPILGWQP